MSSPDESGETARELAALAGAGRIRVAVEEDAIDGVRPALVVEPDSAGTFAAVLAWASAGRRTIVLRGGGTRLAWGRRPGPIDLVLSTRRLERILHYEPGDLTVSVEAGMPIGALNDELARQGQSLPLDTPFDDSTVGGTLATNDSGPLRHRYGAPRDLLIGIHLATTDGRLVKAGGNVVKNVAGYNLGKLVCGSFGSLAAIVSATFKLAPLPAVSSSLVCTFSSGDALAGASAAIATSQLDPVCIDLNVSAGTGPERDGRCRLLLRFGGTAAVNDAQIAEARRLVTAFQPDRLEPLSGGAEASLWRDQVRRPWAPPHALVKASWLPASLAAVVGLIEKIAHGDGLAVDLTGRAAAGVGVIRLAADAGRQIAAIGHLRARGDLLGHVVVARADATVKAGVDVWGPPGDTAPLLRTLKQTMDPAGILNASRGPI